MFERVHATSLTYNKFYYLFVFILEWTQINLYHWHGDVKHQEEALLLIIFICTGALGQKLLKNGVHLDLSPFMCVWVLLKHVVLL